MDDPLFSVRDQVVLVTGAFGLFGRKISESFLKRGAKVIMAGHKKSSVKEISKRYTEEFSSDMFLATDMELKSMDSIETCIKSAVDRFGRIDVLINNASIDAKFDPANDRENLKSRFENYPFGLIEESVNVNQLGTIRITQAVCREMVRQESGNIINVGSVYSVVAPNQDLYDFGEAGKKYKPAGYVASKSFIPNFTRYLASFYAGNNIRCNAIAPHGIFNNHDERFLANFRRLSPAGRMCDLDEIEGPFIFLASKGSSYITGITLVVDGGWTSI